jgi:coenzyme F420 biosynthesis associated uncharacterized protein
VSEALVDWGLARRVAAGVAGDPGRPVPAALQPAELRSIFAEAERLVREYARLEPADELPAPEVVDRGEWSRAVLATLHELAVALERDHAMEVSLPGPLGSVARSFVGAATGTEVGLAAGYAARRVLGQYDVALVGAERPPRLLLVAPNLAGAAEELRVAPGEFIRWVTLHETTHAVQFGAAPWLREHLGELIQSLLRGTLANASLGNLLRRVARDPKGAVSALLRGEIAARVAGPEHAPTLDRIQAAMTLIEGHAEHVMDGAAAEFVADVEELRRRIEQRRRSRGPLETILARLLGLDLKLRQYELGNRFCESVVNRAGVEGLNRAFSGPAALPSLAELERPEAWVVRLGTPARALSV